MGSSSTQAMVSYGNQYPLPARFGHQEVFKTIKVKKYVQSPKLFDYASLLSKKDQKIDSRFVKGYLNHPQGT